jgi:intracellular multiplication protein IcmC
MADQSWLASQANILLNVAQSIPSVERLITGGAYVIGCAFLFKAIFCLKQYGESRTMMSNSTSIKEPLVHLIVGAMLIYFPSTLEVMLATTFGGSGNVLEYAPVNSSNATMSAFFGSESVIARPLIMLIQVVGLVAFVRGWILIARSASQGQPPGGTGKGFMHVFGGILAINIVGTLNIINNTLYGSG